MSKTVVKLNPSLSVLKKKLAKARKALSGDGLKHPNKQASILLDRWVQKGFKEEGKAVGGWDKLKLGGRYKGKGANRKFDATAKVLQDTGRLRASFIPFSTKKTAGIGSDLGYAEQHEKGLNGLPIRRMLPDRKDIKKSILNTYEKYIDRIVRKGILK